MESRWDRVGGLWALVTAGKGDGISDGVSFECV